MHKPSTSSHVRELIDASNERLCEYISHGTTWSLYGDNETCIFIIEKDSIYALRDATASTADIKRSIVNDRIQQYIRGNVIENLNSMLVKDVKEIAQCLFINCTKVEHGKKKNLLKHELRELVKEKLLQAY
jgi:hypothetical protein